MFGNDKSRKNGLNIIVVGGGKVGATLVERLSRENHDVTLIDKNRVKLCLLYTSPSPRDS